MADTGEKAAILAEIAGETSAHRIEEAQGSPVLDPVRVHGYPAGQRRAADKRAKGHRGLIRPSVRHPGGRCFIAVDPGIIRNVGPGARWTLVRHDTPDVTIGAI